MLEQEQAYYAEHLTDWLSQYVDRFVVVKGESLVGVYNTMEEALADGARRFGLQSVLVRRVQPVQEEVKIPALTLGLLHADSSHSVFAAAPAGR